MPGSTLLIGSTSSTLLARPLTKGRVARLAEAVAMLENDLNRAYDEAVHLSNEVIKGSDELALELRRHIDDVAARVIADLRKEADAMAERLRREHEERLKRELEALERKATANAERAILRLAEEIKQLLSEA